MPVYGLRPDDVVVDAAGNVQTGATLTLHASQADAQAAVSALATVTTSAGRWSADVAVAPVWVRTPNGSVYEIQDFAAKADKTYVDSGLAAKLDTSAANSTFATVVNVAGYGAAVGNTAAANDTAFANAIADAKAQKAVLYIPAHPSGNPYQISTRIDVSGLHVRGDGRGSQIKQTVNPNGCLLVNAPDTTIEGLHFISAGRDLSAYTSDATDILASGDTISNGHSAIRIEQGSHRATVRNVSAEGYHAAVNIVSFANQTTSAPAILTDGVVLDGVLSTNCGFAVLGRALRDARINNIRGSFNVTPGLGYPPHLIYLSADSSVPLCENVQISNILVYDGGNYGHAVKIANMKNSTLDNLTARNCRGVLYVLTSTDVLISNVSSYDDNNTVTGPGTATASLRLETCTRVTVRGGRIAFKNIDHMEAIQTTGSPQSSACTVSDFDIVTNYATADTNSQSFPAVRVYGNDHTFANVTVTSIGADKGCGFQVKTATGTQIINPKVSGNIAMGVFVADGTSNTLVDYDPRYMRVKTSMTNSRPIYLDATTSEAPLLRIPASPVADFDQPLAYLGQPRAGSTGFTYWSSGQAVKVTPGISWQYDTSNDGSVWNASTNSTAASCIDTGKTDVEVEVRAKFSGTRVGIALRCLDGTTTQDYLIAAMTANGVEVMSRTAGGAPVQLAVSSGVTVTSGRVYTLRAAIFGNLVQVFLDGVLAVSTTLTGATATTFASATQHGLFASSTTSRFKWAKVRALS